MEGECQQRFVSWQSIALENAVYLTKGSKTQRRRVQPVTRYLPSAFGRGSSADCRTDAAPALMQSISARCTCASIRGRSNWGVYAYATPVSMMRRPYGSHLD